MSVKRSVPFRIFHLPVLQSPCVAIGSSLFIGGQNSITEWTEPRKIKRIFRLHSSEISTLLQCGEIVWSASQRTIELWHIKTGDCIAIIDSENTRVLVQWKNHVISGGVGHLYA